MHKQVYFDDFRKEFRDFGREDHFSYYGLKAIFDYFEEYEEFYATEIELDVIAICCEYCEYQSMEEFWDNYDEDEYPDIESISEHTVIIEIPNSDGFIIADF